MSQILLVEDDPLAQDIASSILQSQGFDVDIAGDGFAALRLLREIAYDAVLVDYHLPEMDGFALARLMRDVSGARRHPLHLIGVTADHNGLAARQGVTSLFDAIIAKPFNPNELLLLLNSMSQRTNIRTGTLPIQSAVTDPGIEGARLAATSFWRARGLSGLPRAVVLPTPTAEESAGLQICFDIVDHMQAELMLILDARGLQQLLRSRLSAGPSSLPVVTIDPALAPFSDACFSVGDRETWSSVADLLKEQCA